MTVSAVNSVSGVTSGNNASEIKKDENIDIDFNSKKTEAQKQTEQIIASAKHQIEYLEAELSDPKTSDTRKAEIKAQIATLKSVYSNTTFKVNSDGSVTFNAKEYVNVEDFKKAYGIKDGALREHLSARHYENRYNGNLDIVEEHGNYSTEPQLGSSIEYSDGYKSTYVKNFWGGLVRQGDYRNMSLNPNEEIRLEQDVFNQ